LGDGRELCAGCRLADLPFPIENRALGGARRKCENL
jgi:hypothetical protein